VEIGDESSLKETLSAEFAVKAVSSASKVDSEELELTGMAVRVTSSASMADSKEQESTKDEVAVPTPLTQVAFTKELEITESVLLGPSLPNVGSGEHPEAISEIPTSLSKSALKNLAKQERYKELKQQRKALEKMKRHQETERKRQEWVQKLAGLSEEEIEKAKQEKMELRTARKDERKERREKLTQALETGQNIVIDLEFGQMMKPNEISSLLQQVMYSYAANGRAEAPCRLSLTGCTGDIHTQLEKISGFNNWLLHKQERSYLSVFEDRKEDLVYLTADSENILERLDPSKIYIVGGLVDRNRWKGVTLEKAKSQGIQTAKLPIGEHMKMLSSQVLTVNQVVEIMLRFAELGDWSKALFAVIPPRKRAAKEVLESVAKQTRISPEQISQNGEQAMDAMSEVGDDFVLVDLVKDIGNAESNVGKEIAQS
jgi:tRNA (guanine9-N1)-methyltransferase